MHETPEYSITPTRLLKLNYEEKTKIENATKAKTLTFIKGNAETLSNITSEQPEKEKKQVVKAFTFK